MLPASMRLTKKDFGSLKTHIIYRGEVFDLAQAEGATLKIACIISKKRIKLATARNSVRRKVLHAISAFLRDKTVTGYFVVYPKPLPRGFAYKKIEEEIYNAFATLQ